MKFLVASMRADLLPLAHRLRREGAEVQTIVWRTRYEGAWGDAMPKAARHSDGSLHADVFQPALESARQGGTAVLTDVRRIRELFAGVPALFPHAEGLSVERPSDPLLFGGWFTGERVVLPHLLIADHGIWTGGAGPRQWGGLTLVRVQPDAELSTPLRGPLAEAIDRLKSVSFRGLFHFDVEEVPTTGEYRLHGLEAGWPWLHTQAFLAELYGFAGLLRGEASHLQKRFVTVLPISVPPWPNERQGSQPVVPIEGLTPQQQGQCFWFDMRVRERKLETAGLDGLVAVATGASNSTPFLARRRALELGARVQVPEKQYRVDAGGLVDAALASLEERWGFVI